MADEMSLDGRVAVITGAAGGIGSETARILGERGATVVIADLPGTKMAEAAATVSGGKAVCHDVDISDEESVKALVAFTVGEFGRVDIVDNNAAGGLPGDIDVLSMSVDVWDAAFNTNARGDMLMIKHALPHMIENGGGSIINISSGTAQAGDMFATAYACSKAAINTLTRYVATQYGGQGIRCNAIAPGLVKTPGLEGGMPVPMQEAMVRAGKLVARLGEPRDIAQMVAFLASDASSWITGQVFPVDGGFFAHLPTVDAVRQLMAGSPG
jgi:NAD(P)-dependent dehydrogenase (short-subunit alcohol dehydrogenase family)